MRIAIGAVVVVVAVLALAQLLGPGIAARVVRGKVQRYGTVKSVTVKAWPAVKLLWRQADEVRVQAGHLRVSPEQTAALLEEAKGTRAGERDGGKRGRGRAEADRYEIRKAWERAAGAGRGERSRRQEGAAGRGRSGVCWGAKRVRSRSG